MVAVKCKVLVVPLHLWLFTKGAEAMSVNFSREKPVALPRIHFSLASNYYYLQVIKLLSSSVVERAGRSIDL